VPAPVFTSAVPGSAARCAIASVATATIAVAWFFRRRTPAKEGSIASETLFVKIASSVTPGTAGSQCEK
jgi:hypothetical protein